MLVQLVEKQRRAVGVVKTALIGSGLGLRSVCVTANSWAYLHGDDEQFSVFVSAPIGEDTEPFYVTGKTLAEAVKNMLDSIKGINGAGQTVQAKPAPF